MNLLKLFLLVFVLLWNIAKPVQALTQLYEPATGITAQEVEVIKTLVVGMFDGNRYGPEDNADLYVQRITYNKKTQLLCLPVSLL